MFQLQQTPKGLRRRLRKALKVLGIDFPKAGEFHVRDDYGVLGVDQVEHNEPDHIRGLRVVSGPAPEPQAIKSLEWVKEALTGCYYSGNGEWVIRPNGKSRRFVLTKVCRAEPWFKGTLAECKGQCEGLRTF